MEQANTSSTKKGQFLDAAIRMQPTPSSNYYSKKEKEKPLVLIIFSEFASHIRAQSLDKVTDSSLQDLNNGVENQIQILKAHSSRSLTPGHHNQLNTAGLALWNWCTHEKRRGAGNDAPPARNRFFSLIRVLSFLMLTLAHRTDDSSQRAIVHLERLAIKTSRSCIGMCHMANYGTGVDLLILHSRR